MLCNVCKCESLKLKLKVVYTKPSLETSFFKLLLIHYVDFPEKPKQERLLFTKKT